jgi:hypothetical protein
MSNSEWKEYSIEDTQSLYCGILKNKRLCNQFEFIGCDTPRLTKKFISEKEMFYWVDTFAESIYVLLILESSGIATYAARVILKERGKH